MTIYARCSSCKKRIPSGTKCDCRKRRYKDDKYNKENIYEAFYKTGEWLKARDRAIEKTDGLDIYSFYILDSIEYGQTVHHIVELKEDYSKRVDVTNLIYLTESNHKKLHNEMDKSPAHKERIQRQLMELLERYKTEMNN